MEQYWPTSANRPGATLHDKEHAAWYNKVKKVVVSRTLKASAFPGLTLIREHVHEQVAQLKAGVGEIILFWEALRLFRN